MDTLKKVLMYYVLNYPNKEQLSNSRMTKMVYLLDWKSCIENGSQVSNIQWVFNHYGPYVDDVSTFISHDNDLNFKHITNEYGSPKNLVILKKGTNYKPDVSPDLQTLLDHIINVTKDLNYDQFIKLVYSTYPVVVSNRYDEFDLPKLAHDYVGLSR